MSEEIVLYMPDFASVRVIQCSPPSWMVQLALEEKGLSYRCETLDFAKGEHRTPEMLARNPRGTIPVLVDGERSIHETYAILAYLEFAYPTPSLYPQGKDAYARALVRFHESSNLKDLGMKVFVALMRTPAEERKSEEIEAMKAELFKELAYWESYLGEGSFLSGEGLSYADLSIFTYVATAQMLGLSLEHFEKISSFMERMRSRPSVRKTWPATWGSPTQDLA